MRNRFTASHLGSAKSHYHRQLSASWRYGWVEPGAGLMALDDALKLIKAKNLHAKRLKETRAAQGSTPAQIRTQQNFRDRNPVVRAKIKMPVLSIQHSEIAAE